MRRLTISGGAVALLAGAALAVGFASGGSAARATEGDLISAQVVPNVGGSTSVDAAPAGPSEGDYYVFNLRLQDEHGKRIGRTDGHCTAITIDNNDTRYQCLVIETLPGGTLVHDGIFEAGKVSHFAILGGTGTYSGARGEAIYSADGQSIVFHLVN
jgi:hypothetical protein